MIVTISAAKVVNNLQIAKENEELQKKWKKILQKSPPDSGDL